MFSAELEVVDAVDWSSGSKIYLASSSYDYREGEFATIKAVQSGVLELAEPLSNFHHGSLSVKTAGNFSVCSRCSTIYCWAFP